MIESLIKSLTATLLIESTAAVLLGVRRKADIKVVICANVITNPVVVYIANIVLMFHLPALYYFAVAVLEVTAVTVEFILYKKFLRPDKVSPFILSLVSNVISFTLGIILNI